MSHDNQNGRVEAFVSVVVLVDDATDVGTRVDALAGEVAARYRDYEVVIVDNGLPSEAVAELRDLLAATPCLRVLRLARRCAVDTAAFAGLEAAIGDVVVVTALDYDRPECVLDVAELVRAGADVVQGLSDAPLGGGPLTRLGRRAFYGYNRRALGVDIPSRSTYLVGLSRGAVNSLSASTRTHRYLRHLVRHIGFRITDYRYALSNARVLRRPGRSKAVDAVEMISSYSTQPLRMLSVAGFVAALANLVYALYVIAITIGSDHVAAGWPTTSLQLSAMFFVICTILAVQAEYIGRILSESRREAAYFITEELESDTLMAEVERRNVAHV